jgi:hypothetical protein
MPRIQLVQTVLVKKDRYPKEGDGVAALATLVDLDRGVMPKKKELETAGFQQQAPNLWTHDDGSWVAHDPTQRAITFGIGSDRLHSLPQFAPKVDRSASPASTRPALQGKDWAWFQKNTAMGKLTDQKLGSFAYDANLGRMALTRDGFVLGQRKGSEEVWAHPDGSWVKLNENEGTVSRGWKGYSSLELQAGEHKGLVRLLEQRVRVPASMKKYAIANIGIVSSATVARVCKSKGFVKVDNTWIHSDGSWVKASQGSIRVGWKGHTLDELPYSNGYGWS